MKYWLFYVAVFYSAWLTLVLAFGYWGPAIQHWPIAVAMALGSVVAGSTPMGGGTVSFPVLVLLFGRSANIGRNFAMAIQALGMTSAMVFSLCRRTPIQSRLLAWSTGGAALGLLIGTFGVAPILKESIVKLLFSSVWFSFGILTFAKNREICGLSRRPEMKRFSDAVISAAVGLTGGIINSITGVGIEMVLYTVLVLRYRCDLKVAIPTAVSMGALTSVMGIGLHGLLGDIGREVFYNWLAAAPVVVFGAPAGAFLVSVLPRIRTLYFVALLCVLQFLWTLQQVAPRWGEWLFVGSILFLANIGFHYLYHLGKKAVSPAPRLIP